MCADSGSQAVCGLAREADVTPGAEDVTPGARRCERPVPTHSLQASAPRSRGRLGARATAPNAFGYSTHVRSRSEHPDPLCGASGADGKGLLAPSLDKKGLLARQKGEDVITGGEDVNVPRGRRCGPRGFSAWDERSASSLPVRSPRPTLSYVPLVVWHSVPF